MNRSETVKTSLNRSKTTVTTIEKVTYSLKKKLFFCYNNYSTIEFKTMYALICSYDRLLQIAVNVFKKHASYYVITIDINY